MRLSGSFHSPAWTVREELALPNRSPQLPADALHHNKKPKAMGQRYRVCASTSGCILSNLRCHTYRHKLSAGCGKGSWDRGAPARQVKTYLQQYKQRAACPRGDEQQACVNAMTSVPLWICFAPQISCKMVTILFQFSQYVIKHI